MSRSRLASSVVATLTGLALGLAGCADDPMGPDAKIPAHRTAAASLTATSTVAIAGVSGATTDADAVYPSYMLRYTGNPAPSGYSHDYQWATPKIITASPEDGPVVMEGTIDVSDHVEGQVAMIGLLDAGALAAGETGFQRGAYIYVFRTSSGLRIGVTDGNSGGEIVQSFATIPDADVPADGVFDVTFTVDGTANGTACAAGPATSPAGCMTLNLVGGSVNVTLTDSYGDIRTPGSASPEFSAGAVPGWDDYIGSMVAYDLMISPASVDDTGPVTTSVVATPNPVQVSETFELTALVDDAGTGGSVIASASYSVNGGAWQGMAAEDGTFDEVTESATATVVHGLAPGLYDVCVRGTDASGNVGLPECSTVVVYDPSGGFVTGGGWFNSTWTASADQLVWDQGFESDAAGWLDASSGWYGTATRVASGANGITSSAGSWHAIFAGDQDSAPFSRFDEFRDVWPGTWTAEIDVYLDPAWDAGAGFDYSVAASGSDGNHQRDYIFHVGVHDDGRLLVNGSNNTDFQVNDFKLVNDGDGTPYEVTQAGWYTLQHVFREESGALAVDLNLLDANGTVLFTTTRFNAVDAIPAEVGGNRYGWFTFISVDDGIAVDEHEMVVPESATYTGKATFGFVSRYRKGASTPDGNTQFQFKAADLTFHSTSYQWLVVNQGGENAQFKGEGAVNGIGGHKFMLWAGDHDSGDTFRIRIWREEGGQEIVVYDNGVDQPIEGGNIIVHDGRKK